MKQLSYKDHEYKTQVELFGASHLEEPFTYETFLTWIWRQQLELCSAKVYTDYMFRGVFISILDDKFSLIRSYYRDGVERIKTIYEICLKQA